MQAISIKDLLPFVYDVEPNMIVGIPKWLESDRYSIIAKPPTEVSMDALRVMLRNLFIEQFKLETHKEEQQVQVYVMTVSKKGLKMEKAEPGTPPRMQTRRHGQRLDSLDVQGDHDEAIRGAVSPVRGRIPGSFGGG